MRHHHARDPRTLAHSQDQLVDHVAHDRIEACGGLVVENQQGVECQGPREPGAFAHAAGDLHRFLVQHGSRQSDLVEERDHDGAGLRRRQPRVFTDWKGDVVGDRHAVEQRRPLKNESVASAEVGQFPLAHAGQRPPFKPYFPLRGPYQADHGLEKHCLAATALAEHGERLAGRNVERDISQHFLRAESHAEPLDLEQRRFGLFAAGCGKGGGDWHGGGVGAQRSRRGPSGRKKSCTLLSQIPRKRSRNRINTKECTKALVADRPTPSAP